MPATLAQFRTRVRDKLVDTAGSIYVSAIVDEALRQALHDYSHAWPYTYDTYVVLPGDGSEIALDDLTGLTGVVVAWWPYDSTQDNDANEQANIVTGFKLVWDDARPLLILSTEGNAQPQLDDELRVWYTKLHTIQDLDSEAVTTVRIDHESILATGAAGYAALYRAVDLTETYGTKVNDRAAIEGWAQRRLTEFKAALRVIADANTAPGKQFGAGWSLDKYDAQP